MMFFILSSIRMYGIELHIKYGTQSSYVRTVLELFRTCSGKLSEPMESENARSMRVEPVPEPALVPVPGRPGSETIPEPVRNYPGTVSSPGETLERSSAMVSPAPGLGFSTLKQYSAHLSLAQTWRAARGGLSHA